MPFVWPLVFVFTANVRVLTEKILEIPREKHTGPAIETERDGEQENPLRYPWNWSFVSLAFSIVFAIDRQGIVNGME